MGISYAKREQILRSLTATETSYTASLVDAKLQSSSRSLEGFLHRRFYPERRTIAVDWPNYSSSPTWQIDLQGNEIISLTEVTAGGVDITAGCYLSRADNLAEPPYSLLNVDLSAGVAFSSGDTFQRAVNVTGLFGFNDTSTASPGGALNGAINSSVTTVGIEPVNGIFTIGVGSLLLVGTERMAVIGRQMVSTTRTTTSALLANQASASFTCANASEFANEETILIDSEKMRIDEIAGTTIFVTRAFDGTALAAHSSGSTIYASRQFIVQRGVLGSTAASHSDADSVYDHEFPALVNELCIAETVFGLENSASAYARSVGTGGRDTEVSKDGLEDVRQRAWMAYARKSRSAAV